ncbi:heme-binding protein 2-like [Babylonia areolata]|uniref:heme-binding protein 2-like n=1 Tax=Babylonia areolata TaxID=304850 RepID=UPI003FD073D9
MTRKHVTTWLMTCLMLVGASSASIVRTFTFEADSGDSQPQRTNVQEKAMHNNETTGPATAPYDPPMCKRFPCPPSSLKEDMKSYRKEYFPEAWYAKVHVEGKPMISALFAAYDKLSKYFNGANEDLARLPMTSPIIFRVDPGEPGGMFSPRNFTLFFYIHPKVKLPPPAPLDKEIVVLEVNSYTLYVRTFSSYTVNYADWMRELLQLAADVESNGEEYRKEYFYFATYDSPYHLNNRINEVQLLAPHPDSPGL